MRTSTMNALIRRAAAGAAFLDEKRPGWHRRITQNRLSIASTVDCILGQLYGDYCDGTDKLDLSPAKSQDFGFAAGPLAADSWEQFPVLNDAWKTLVRERRAADRQKVAA